MHRSSVNPLPPDFGILGRKTTSFRHPRSVARPYFFLPTPHEDQQQQYRNQIEDTTPSIANVTRHDEEKSDIDEVDEATFIEEMVQECHFLPPDEFLQRLKPSSFKRWKKYNENASLLDVQFNKNKERIFNERLEELLGELAAAEAGTHDELKAQVDALERQRLSDLKKIRIIEDLKTESVNIRYEHECRAAQEGLEAEKRSIQNAWKSLMSEHRNLASLPAAYDDTRSRKRRKKDRSLTVGEILRDKIGMVNAVANRRLAMDRMKEADRLANMIQNRNEAELDGDMLVIRKKVAEAERASSVNGSHRSVTPNSSPRLQNFSDSSTH